MASLSCRGSFVALMLLMFFALSGSVAWAADQCPGDGQILLPSGTCMAGYYGYAVSNCQAVGNNALVVQVPSGHLTCVAGPSCPDGYQQGLPPPQNGTPGFPNPMPGYQVSKSMCQAVCTSVMAQNHWPCSCPYGQKLDTKTGSCAPTCGDGATWQHTPGYDSQLIGNSYVVADPGMCTCPSDQEYVTVQSACMTPCKQGEIRDGAGKCYSPYAGGGSGKVCNSGQKVGACQCPSGGIIKNGICIICAISGPNGVGTPGQDPACKNAGSGNNDGDEVGPRFPTQPGAAGCTPGSHWNGLKCVANKPASPSCPAGSHWNGSACVANNDGDGYQPVRPMQPTNCLPGTHWNGLKCVANTPAVPACAAGSRWNGSACVPVRIPMCPRGTSWNGSECAPPRVAPTPRCPSDQHWNGRTCIANGCSQREHWDGRQCVANP
jgi:hypothetical protein